MQKHIDLPGSPAWHARRARCFNAGDASAMLGCHPSGKTRTQLLQELHTGIERGFSDYVQEKVIDPGHRIEALWRPIAEEILGEDLQVLAGTLAVGLSRPLGASLDGCTFMEDVLGECKSANEALRAALPHSGRDSHARNDARHLPKGYRVQMEQQQLVTGATRTLFSACQFDAEGNPTEERHCWYAGDPALRAEILAGWKQFDADLAAYVPPAASSVEKIVAEPVEALPSVSVKVEGSIVIHENFDAFEVAMRDFLEHRLIREPKTDQHFADLERQIKSMKGAEAALDNAEESWIAQIETVSAKKRRKDMLKALVRDNRLLSEKLLTSEKERRKGDIVGAGVKALADHVAALNVRLGRPLMPQIPADFGGCIRGLKSLASMEDKVATELARAKIHANEVADRIQANLAALRELAADHAFLFADTPSLVLKAADDCRATITSRIGEHRQAEEKRLEAERARIRAEEEARARATAAREQQEREAAERRQREVDEAAQRQAREQIEAAERRAHQATLTHPNGAPMFGEQIKDNGDHLMLDAQGKRSVFCDIDEGDAPAANVHPMPTRAPAAPSTPPSLRLGQINERLQRCKVTADDLAALGFPAAARDRSAVLFHEADFRRICDALMQCIAAARDGQKAVA